MKTKHAVLFFPIFFFLFFAPVYSQWEGLSEIKESRSDAQIQKEDNTFLPISTNLDSFITATMAAYHIPGLSACILKEGKLAWHNAYGYADLERQIPVTDSTLFSIASISKTITGTALMQLYERGLFNLDDNVNNYLPPDLQVANPSYPNSPINFKMLLSHASSINDNWDVLEPLTSTGDSPIPLYDFLKGYLVPGGPYYTNTSYGSYPPANTHNYSNIGAGLLGYLIEAITDTAFADYCQKHIFTPLSMNETSWFLSNLDTSHVARPYQWTASGYKPCPHWGFTVYPAGQLRTSSLQLARFLNAFMQKGTLENTKILDSSTVALMTTAHYPTITLPSRKTAQGLIWFERLVGDRKVWGHGGGLDPGAATSMFYYEPEKIGVITLMNIYELQGDFNIRSALFDYAAAIPTEMARDDENVLEVFMLKQNYPNPFNPSTIISYQLPVSSHVDLSIYNLLGQKVLTLVSEQQSAGVHKFNFDAKRLASGVYLYRLEAGSFTQTKKLILMR